MDTSGGPLERNVCNCTLIIVSLLKAWKATVVGIECPMPPFNIISSRSTPEIISKFCEQGGKLNYSRYSQVSLLTLCYHWKTLSNLEMSITKRSLQYFTYFLSIGQYSIVQIDVVTTLSIIIFLRHPQIKKHRL